MPLLIFSNQRLDGLQPLPKADLDFVLPVVPLALEEQVSSISFRITGSRPYRLETGSLGKPMAAMRLCLTNLVKRWGYDPSSQATLAKPAVPLSSPASWFSTNAFPSTAAMGGHNGYVQFRLDVDETGLVTACHVLGRTNPDEFADLSCRILAQRAKFSPAFNAEGKPVKSFNVNKVIWFAFG